MKFEYLSKAAFEALTEYGKEKYLDEKRNHEMKETQEAAKVAAETAAGVAVAAVKTELEAVINTQKEEIAAIKVSYDEVDKKYEEAMTKMNRIQTRQKEEETAGLKAEIHKALTEKDSEGFKQLQNFKSTKKFSLEIDSDDLLMKEAGTIGVPSGTTAQSWLMPIGIPHENIQARDIIPVLPTSNTQIKYVQFIKKDGSIGSVAAGTRKRQFDFTPVPKSADVVKIAGFVTVQEEFLDDITGSGAFLAQELPWAYKDEETRQVFKGNSSAMVPELGGLFSEVGTAISYAGFETAGPNSNNWDKMVVGLTNSRRNLRPGDAIWISPEAYAECLMNKSEGDVQEYDYPIQATTAGQLAIGGIPIYFHTVFDPLEGLAGNYRRGVALWQRKGITLRTSTEADQNFFENLVTFLIEARVAMTPFYPESFKKLDFTRTT